LTADEEDQWGPMALENHIVYRQKDADGLLSVEIHQREATLKPYASSTLQIGVIIAISLLFIHLMQRQMEAKRRNQPP
jgi:Na+/proline symporter